MRYALYPLVAALLLFCSIHGNGQGFTGDWQTSYGAMTLHEEDGSVAGYYIFNGVKCEIAGKIADDKLVFHYQEPRAQGEGWFVLAADGQSFAGKWREQNSEMWDSWTGKRATSKQQENTFSGLWQTSYGLMRMFQEGDAVEGIYKYGSGGSVKGKLVENKLTFRYQEPTVAGEGWFELSADGNSFQGQWRADNTEAWSPWSGSRVVAQENVLWLVVIEARWENGLAEREYSFGDMLEQFFLRVAHVQIRHRYFSNSHSLRKWCQEVAFLAEPVVLVIATHATAKGLAVDGKTIEGKTIADALRYTPNLKLLHFSACLIMQDRQAEEIRENLPAAGRFPISGYVTSVDWAASAIIEFMYFDMILSRRMPVADAAQALPKLLPFAGEQNIPGVPVASAGFRILLPE